jgi:eukaryotic-like serine/threonine-protein kinase
MSHYALDSLESALPRFANFKLLGQGGEGAVFEVWDRIKKTDLALKLMRDSGDPDLGDRFEHEYRILASSRSDRLVRVFEHGQEIIPTGGAAFNHYWYTMEKCESSVRSTYRRMPLARRIDVVAQMLDGLAFLHAKDIAHRDIKPDNIFLVKGQIKIGDFGLAKTHQAAQAGAAVRIGHFMGSPPYLAPERWTGQQDADWRPSDQYAAGVTVFELLSAGGAPLDFGTTQDSCFQAHWSGRAFPLQIPELGGRPVAAVDRALGRMLAKRPEGRYRELAECKRELFAALAHEGVWNEGR